MGSGLPFAGRQFGAFALKSAVVLLLPRKRAGFIPVVYVLTVRAAVGEPLLAFWTLEWFLSTVQSPVLGQVVFVFESLLTIRAFMWPQVCNSSL